MASAASTAAGQLVEAAAWAGGLLAVAARPAADFWVAVVVLVACPRVAVVAPESSSSWTCRRRFRQEAPYGVGSQVAQAAAARVAGYGAGPFL
jgi:hypothetical protein